MEECGGRKKGSVNGKLICFAALLWALPLNADGIPSPGIPPYNYFYTCDSGIVNCETAFPPIYDSTGVGDIAQYDDAPIPLGGFLGTAYFHPEFSNNLGEVLGIVSVPDQDLPAEPYALGVDGQIICLPGAPGLPPGLGCLTDEEQTLPYPGPALNDNGLYIINGPAAYGGIGFEGQIDMNPSDDLYRLTGDFVFSYLAINDQNQLLVESDNGMEGVLSPFQVVVPEPSSLLLLFTVAGALGLGLKRRSYGER